MFGPKNTQGPCHAFATIGWSSPHSRSWMTMGVNNAIRFILREPLLATCGAWFLFNFYIFPTSVYITLYNYVYIYIDPPGIKHSNRKSTHLLQWFSNRNLHWNFVPGFPGMMTPEVYHGMSPILIPIKPSKKKTIHNSHLCCWWSI